jgi:uncharacterized lipoprotein YddW (UPF0748 family)
MNETQLVPLACVQKEKGFVKHYQSEELVMIPKDYQEKSIELRGAWIATVGHVDLPSCESRENFQAAYIKALDEMVTYHMNAVFVQVRPMNDAYYESRLNPYSRYLCGGADGFVEGKNPGFDVMNFFIDETHNRGMEFHAWLNPYRVTSTHGINTADLTLEEKQALKEKELNKLHPTNFAKQNPDTLLMSADGQLIYDPGNPKAKKFILATIEEIIQNYKVDGIHFDDYFYPSSGIDTDLSDQKTYQLYGTGDNIEDFRRNSVTALVKDIKELVDSHNAKGNRVIFGISPFGMWRHRKNDERGSNSDGGEAYTKWYADTLLWVEKEYLHYIMPQLYWEFEHPVAKYADLADWWSKVMKGSKVLVYIGTPFYRFDGYKDTVDRYSTPNMIKYAQKDDVIQGHVLWHNKKLYSQENGELVQSQKILKSMWQHDVKIPKYDFEKKGSKYE